MKFLPAPLDHNSSTMPSTTTVSADNDPMQLPTMDPTMSALNIIVGWEFNRQISALDQHSVDSSFSSTAMFNPAIPQHTPMYNPAIPQHTPMQQQQEPWENPDIAAIKSAHAHMMGLPSPPETFTVQQTSTTLPLTNTTRLLPLPSLPGTAPHQIVNSNSSETMVDTIAQHSVHDSVDTTSTSSSVKSLACISYSPSQRPKKKQKTPLIPTTTTSRAIDTENNSSSKKECTFCGTRTTPLWRTGPAHYKLLCNGCGIKWRRGKILNNVKEWKSTGTRSTRNRNSNRMETPYGWDQISNKDKLDQITMMEPTPAPTPTAELDDDQSSTAESLETSHDNSQVALSSIDIPPVTNSEHDQEVMKKRQEEWEAFKETQMQNWTYQTFLYEFNDKYHLQHPKPPYPDPTMEEITNPFIIATYYDPGTPLPRNDCSREDMQNVLENSLKLVGTKERSWLEDTESDRAALTTSITQETMHQQLQLAKHYIERVRLYKQTEERAWNTSHEEWLQNQYLLWKERRMQIWEWE